MTKEEIESWYKNLMSGEKSARRVLDEENMEIVDILTGPALKLHQPHYLAL